MDNSERARNVLASRTVIASTTSSQLASSTVSASTTSSQLASGTVSASTTSSQLASSTVSASTTSSQLASSTVSASTTSRQLISLLSARTLNERASVFYRYFISCLHVHSEAILGTKGRHTFRNLPWLGLCHKAVTPVRTPRTD